MEYAVNLLFQDLQLINQQNKPVWSVATKFLLIDITRHELYVTATTFNILLEFYRVLNHQNPIFVTEFWKFSRYGKVLCI